MDSAPLSLLLLLLLSCLLLSPLTTAAPPPAPAITNLTNSHHGLLRICKTTPFPKLCLNSSKLSISITINPSILSFALHALQAAVSAISGLSPLLASPSVVEAQRGALQDCRELHAATLSSLRRSSSLLHSSSSKNAVADARAHLSAALTNKNTCLEGLAGARGPQAPALISAWSSAFRDVSNSLSIVSGSGGGRRRGRRLSSWPSAGWLRRRERKLLGTGDYSAYDAAVTLTVAADGSGDFRTVGEAVAFAPNNSEDRTIIIVRAGVYDENVEIPLNKTNIALLGEGSNVTFIRGNRSVGDGWTTFRSATVGNIERISVHTDLT
ncbi:putative pectinesterase/pectinesterase inhibitor 12 [Platanthera zijinensis]|uniref:Pectinesterase/pectinesterase inhibitor 12 n=1 Tax=Platanthera zijinensis TaxID=2320716 RepID=A0AAP0G0V3_9ASPA